MGVVNNTDSEAQFRYTLTLIIPTPSMPAGQRALEVSTVML